MYIGTAIDRVNDRRQAGCPRVGALPVANEILPDLDQRMRETVDDSVAKHCVAEKRAVVKGSL
jgi:hypothetical protein